MSASLICPLANGLWYLLSLREARAFRRSCRDVAQTQRQYLLSLLRRNADTGFGRRHGFSQIKTAAEFQQRVPLADFDDYQPAIEQIGAGQSSVLTSEPVLLLEPTSGSTAASKYIPYTASLKAEFQRAIAPWVVDLYSHYPGLLGGQAYWSVTPVVRRNERAPGGIPIGFEDDSAYFGRLQQYLINAVLAVPPQVKLLEDMAAFRYITLLFLLRSRSLRLMSVWNPTFLTLLAAPLTEWWPRLAGDIEAGTLSPPASLPSDLTVIFSALNRPAPRRAAKIRAAFQQHDNPGEIHRRLWPQLGLISCWADAHAALQVTGLAQLFPQARLQGKGLLATEGVVSFPLVGQTGAALAIRSHFFEFIPEGQPEAQPALAHQLRPGQTYEVVLTTGGGLYRYRLYDLVEVTGHRDGCPLLRFMGKAGNISDRFGEKLNERHVSQIMARLFQDHGLRPTFAMLACEEIGLERPAYLLFIEVGGPNIVPDALLAALGRELEATLQENFHYRYCRDLQQLDRLRVFRISSGGLEAYLARCQAQGQRAGAIKPVALHRLDGWLGAFQGRLLN